MYVTTNRFNVFHQVVHLHHHLMTEGVGLRQVMDYYMLLKNGFDNAELEDIKAKAMNIFRHLGIKWFASALMWV